MTNTEIAEQFSLLADLMEIRGENPFKIKSYSKAADVIEEYPTAIVQTTDEQLYQIKGIGQAVGEKVRELQHTGRMQALEDLLAAIPAGVVSMLKVKGLSPKKIGTIWQSLHIETIDQLEEACLLNRIAPVKGFGDKTQKSIHDAIAFYKRSLGAFRLATVIPFAEELQGMLKGAYPGHLLELTGAYRRQLEVIDLLELVTDIPGKALSEVFSAIEDAAVSDIIDHRLLVQLPGKPPLLFHLVTTAHFYTALFSTTAAAPFLQAFEAQYDIPEAAGSEAAIFTAGKLPYIHPALRETPGILEAAAKHRLPELITIQDIRGLIHAHSTYSDGADSLEAMATAARDMGLEYLVITDHSQAAFYAAGMKPEQIIAQHAEIDRLNQTLHPFKIFKGIEADILADGRLDYDDGILDSFDLVIASVHSNLNMSEEKATKRLLAAIANPRTRILGHPTGRQLLIREGYPIDHKAVIDACIAHKVVLEINANPRRLDLDWRWVRYALERGALLSINPDAHSIKGIGDLRYGVLAAQKGGLGKEDNLSSFSLAQFEAFLARR